MTGREAVLEATGEAFVEVEARRQEKGPTDPAPQFVRVVDAVAPNEAEELPAITATGRHMQ